MKRKIISLLLSAELILCMLPVFGSAEEKPLKLTVTTDTHMQSYEAAGDLEPDPGEDLYTRGMLDRDIFYYASQQGQLNYESTALMKQLLNDFAASDDEYMLIGGDLTNGARSSHLQLASMLKETEEKTGKKIFVTCGNHDCSAKADETHIDVNEFKSIYADFGFSEALCAHDSSASYTYDLSDGYRLLAIDSCIYGEDDGEINKSVFNWIKEQVAAAEKDGVKLIGMMHHSILPHFEVQPMIKNYMSRAEYLADAGVKLMFTGHIHANDISSATTNKGNTIYDVQTGSLLTSPNAYRRVSITDESIEIKSEYITSIDLSDLPAGYSDEQLNMIENDFAAYSYSFFEAGMCRWLNRYIGSALKVGKTLKLKEGGAAFELLNALMLKIGDALLLPIYDNGEGDSIEGIANSVKCEIPESDYEMVYQVVAKVMNGFYHGDEPDSIKETEIPLLLDCVKVCLAHCISNMLYSGRAMSEFDSLITELTGTSPKISKIKRLTKLNYAAAASCKIVEAVVEPLLSGLSCDFSAPYDIDVTIDGYYSSPVIKSDTPLSWLKRIALYFRHLFESLMRTVAVPYEK